jgi:hypothetical protein
MDSAQSGQLADSVAAKRPKTPDAAVAERAHRSSRRQRTSEPTAQRRSNYEPDYPPAQSHISNSVPHNKRLRNSILLNYLMEEEFQRLCKETGLDVQALKRSWEVLRRLDLMAVVDTYTLVQVMEAFEVAQDQEFLKLFRKMHYREGLRHEGKSTTDKTSFELPH